MGHKRKGKAAKQKRQASAEVILNTNKALEPLRQLCYVTHNYGLFDKDLYDIVKERLEEQDCS